MHHPVLATEKKIRMHALYSTRGRREGSGTGGVLRRVHFGQRSRSDLPTFQKGESRALRSQKGLSLPMMADQGHKRLA